MYVNVSQYIFKKIYIFLYILVVFLTKMGGASSSLLTPEDIEELRDPLISGFTSLEIKKLYKRFKHLDRKEKGYLTQNDLELIPELSLNPLCERIIELFDPTDMNQINFKEFVRVLWIFSNKCNKNLKLKYAFKLFDIDNDNKINSNDLYRLIKIMVGKHFDQQKLSKLCKKIINDGEISSNNINNNSNDNNKGYLSKNEFINAIGESNLIQLMTVPFTFNKNQEI